MLKSLAHLLTYSVAFGGTSLYSYWISPVAFRTLERQQFSILQNKVFPHFFLLQTVSPVVLGLLSPLQGPRMIASLAVASLSGAVNRFGLLHKVQVVKEKRLALKEGLDSGRINQVDFETRDAPLRKQFGMFHGLSLLFNLTYHIGLLYYGVLLV